MNAFQKLLSGKMSSQQQHPTTEMTSTSSSKSSANLSMKDCLYLDLRGGQTQGRLWATMDQSHGVSWTRNIGECPNVDVESSLSAILEDNPPEKYFLSSKACAGILQRAKRRGKNLPPRLERALIAQMQQKKNQPLESDHTKATQ